MLLLRRLRMILPPHVPRDSTTKASIVQGVADGELPDSQLEDGREFVIGELAVLGRCAHILDQGPDLLWRELRRPATPPLGRRIARLACPLDLAVRDALALGDFFVGQSLRAQPEDVDPGFLRQVSRHAARWSLHFGRTTSMAQYWATRGGCRRCWDTEDDGEMIE
ncbi:hypothetical protein MauCBS54593_005863 [Microsporum audouinii]